jgi:hypothetical protein
MDIALPGVAQRVKLITATRDLTAASGVVSYTGVGFRPRAVIALVAVIGGFRWAAGFQGSIVDDGGVIYQYAASTMAQGTQFLRIDSGGGTEQYIDTIDSYDADGFTVTWTKAGLPTGTAQLMFLCFE